MCIKVTTCPIKKKKPSCLLEAKELSAHNPMNSDGFCESKSRQLGASPSLLPLASAFSGEGRIYRTAGRRATDCELLITAPLPVMEDSLAGSVSSCRWRLMSTPR